MLSKNDQNKINSLMGQELGELFSNMVFEWADVRYRWQNFKLLFNKNGVYILNKVSSGGFRYVQAQLRENLIVSVCRMLDHDQKKTAKKIQAHINEHNKNSAWANKVSNKIDEAFLYVDAGLAFKGEAQNKNDEDKQLGSVKKHKKMLFDGSLREVRHRRIAHRDTTFRPRALKELDAVNLALEATQDALETIYKHYTHEELPSIYASAHDMLPAEDLLKSLSELTQAYEESTTQDDQKRPNHK